MRDSRNLDKTQLNDISTRSEKCVICVISFADAVSVTSPPQVVKVSAAARWIARVAGSESRERALPAAPPSRPASGPAQIKIDDESRHATRTRSDEKLNYPAMPCRSVRQL